MSFGQARKEELFGQHDGWRVVVTLRAPVMLREERGDDFFVRNLGVLYGDRDDIPEATRTHVEDGDLRELAFAIDADDVPRDGRIDVDDALRFADLLNRGELIAIDGSELEPHLARGGAHTRLEFARELVVTTLEEHRDALDLLGVPSGSDVVDAGRGAALDLELKARALPREELAVAARPQLEVFVDQMKRAPCGRRRVIRTKVTPTIVRGAPHDRESRPRVIEPEADRQELFVV